MLVTTSTKFASWKEFYTSRPIAPTLNKLSHKIVSLTNPVLQPSDEVTWDEIKQNKHHIFITRNSIGEDVIIIHSLSFIGGSIEAPTKHHVGLVNFSDLATSICLTDQIIADKKSFAVPSLEDLKKASDVAAFKSTVASTNALSFRPMVAIPPFIAQAFLRHQSVDPSALGLVALSATNAFLEQMKDDTSLEVDKISEAGYYIACFLWGVANNLIPNSTSGPAIQPVVQEWFSELQQKYISP